MEDISRFSLLLAESDGRSQAEQSVDYAQFRRPASLRQAGAPRAKAPLNAAPNEKNAECNADSPTERREEKRQARPSADTFSSLQPAPLLSVLPSALSSEEETPRPCASDAEPKPKPKMKPPKRVVMTLQQSAGAFDEQAWMPQTQTPKKKSAHSARRTAWIVAIAAVLLAGMVCADRYLMPSIRYREALKDEAEGNYDQAAVLFAALGDYRDSAERLERLPQEEALSLMNSGSYREAMELLEKKAPDDPLIADCLYALGETACNDGDPETGLKYVAQLRKRFPDYGKTEVFAQKCNYSLGSRYADRFDGCVYSSQGVCGMEQAISYFENAGDYEDAVAQAQALRYSLACALIGDEGWQDIPKAVTMLEELGDYGNAAACRLDAMHEYVQKRFLMYRDDLFEASYFDDTDFLYPDYSVRYDDELLAAYLEELAASDYEGAQALLDRFNGVGFSLSLFYGEEGTPLPDTVTDLSKVYLRYEIPDTELPVRPFLRIKFPNELSIGTTVLMEESSSVLSLSDLVFFDETEGSRFSEAGEIVIALYDGVPAEFLLHAGDLFVHNEKDPLAYASFRYEPAPTTGG